jgi:hypothetical protein
VPAVDETGQLLGIVNRADLLKMNLETQSILVATSTHA